MSATTAAGAPRQLAIVGLVAGLHIGAYLLVASGVLPRVLNALPAPPPILVLPPPPEPVERAPPAPAMPEDPVPLSQPEPDVAIPRLPDTADTRDGGPESTGAARAGDPRAEAVLEPPVLRLPDRRMADLIGACYPASSRRLGEEGRAVVRIALDAEGRVRQWSLTHGSGYPRLDSALDCVIPRLRFRPGRVDGRAVAAEAQLPIVFRLD
jgi:protein TonB